MKKLTILLILIYATSVAQVKLPLENSNKSQISGIQGSNNIITVIQGNGNIVKYNLLDENDAPKFLEYLRNLPNLNDNIKQILKYDKTTLDIVTKIYAKITDESVFSPKKFLECYVEKEKETEKLKKELEELRKQTTDADFTKALEEANKKLEEYDNDGYQKVLEYYKTKKKNKVNQELKEIAQASYLQAQNNYDNFSYSAALSQINEALEYDKENIDYLFLKADINFDIPNYDESLALFIKIITYNINDTLKSSAYNNIGVVYCHKGDYNQALEYHRKALAIDEKVFGKDHSSTATSYSNIGTVYDYKNDYDHALEYLGKASAIDEKVLGKDHPDIATLYNNIGEVYSDKGDYDRAMEYFSKALTIDEKVLGKDHPNTATTYNNIGGVYSGKGDYDHALEYLGKALTIDEKVLGKDHPSTATLYINIGVVNKAKGDYAQALECFGKALTIDEKVLGKEHLSTITIYENIGLLLIARGDKEKGLNYMTKTSFSKMPAHEKSYILNWLGVFNLKKGKYKEALNFHQLALEFLEESNTPKTDAYWANIYQNMANAYCHYGQKDKALPLFEKALLLCKDVKEGEIDIEAIKKNYEECKSK
ncbi:MAG: tetratricopeptide repeat protein [Bacteroidales bacterium]|nr:tetratricopeptide repeat protein [Bacteroidales bacterium]